jgi:hypothetical protein
VGDFVGQRYFSAPHVTKAAPASGANISGIPTVCSAPCTPSSSLATFNNAFTGFPTIDINTTSYNVDNVAVGLKVNPIGHLILSANALIRLDDAGLRPARFVPLVGVSYRF